MKVKENLGHILSWEVVERWRRGEGMKSMGRGGEGVSLALLSGA